MYIIRFEHNKAQRDVGTVERASPESLSVLRMEDTVNFEEKA